MKNPFAPPNADLAPEHQTPPARPGLLVTIFLGSVLTSSTLFGFAVFYSEWGRLVLLLAIIPMGVPAGYMVRGFERAAGNTAAAALGAITPWLSMLAIGGTAGTLGPGELVLCSIGAIGTALSTMWIATQGSLLGMLTLSAAEMGRAAKSARGEWFGRVECARCGSMQTEPETWNVELDQPETIRCNACGSSAPAAARSRT